MNSAFPFLVGLVVLIPLIYWAVRETRSRTQSGFQTLQRSFEGMQRHLVVLQGELERSLEHRSGNLRTEISAALQTGRKELQEGLQRVEENLRLAEKQLLNVSTVGNSINDLNNLLKLPHLRGQFGEAMLERLLTDLVPVDQFELQYRVDPNSSERVDAVIKYPRCVLPIDSKFPREQVLPLFETS
jgi:DNA anti-recombination protein RmuC